MNENVEKWVAALRSGNYLQTKGKLRGKRGFCCLGVACDVYSKETGEGEWSMGAHTRTSYSFGVDGIYIKDHLPQEVVEWFGLSTKDGGWRHSSLSMRNDTGSSFNKIADIIESEPNGLFR